MPKNVTGRARDNARSQGEASSRNSLSLSRKSLEHLTWYDIMMIWLYYLMWYHMIWFDMIKRYMIYVIFMADMMRNARFCEYLPFLSLFDSFEIALECWAIPDITRHGLYKLKPNENWRFSSRVFNITLLYLMLIYFDIYSLVIILFEHVPTIWFGW